MRAKYKDNKGWFCLLVRKAFSSWTVLSQNLFWTAWLWTLGILITQSFAFLLRIMWYCVQLSYSKEKIAALGINGKCSLRATSMVECGEDLALNEIEIKLLQACPSIGGGSILEPLMVNWNYEYPGETICKTQNSHFRWKNTTSYFCKGTRSNIVKFLWDWGLGKTSLEIRNCYFLAKTTILGLTEAAGRHRQLRKASSSRQLRKKGHQSWGIRGHEWVPWMWCSVKWNCRYGICEYLEFLDIFSQLAVVLEIPEGYIETFRTVFSNHLEILQIPGHSRFPVWEHATLVLTGGFEDKNN